MVIVLPARMRRASAIPVAALVAVASLAAAAPTPVVAGTSDCSIQIRGRATVYTSFRAAFDAAAAGRTLLLRGTCRVDPKVIRKDLTIKGVGESNKLIPSRYGRVLTVDDGAVVTLSNLVIRGGDEALRGGGLSVTDGAQVTLRDVTVTDNKLSGVNLSGQGGGIYVGCSGPYIPTSLTMVRTTVSGNTVRTTTVSQDASGGGIHVGGCGTATITNSTIAGNKATATAARAYGGGITVDGAATITHTTIVGNTASDGGSSSSSADTSGGGLRVIYGIVLLEATIIAGNRAETGKACDTGGSQLGSLGYNIIDIVGGCDGVTNGVVHDQVGTKANPVDPLLGKLALNGGLTRSMLPKPASPALDAIPAISCEVNGDQRQRQRPNGDGCDIGAVER